MGDPENAFIQNRIGGRQMHSVLVVIRAGMVFWRDVVYGLRRDLAEDFATIRLDSDCAVLLKFPPLLRNRRKVATHRY